MQTLERIGNKTDAFTALQESFAHGEGGQYFLGAGGNRKAYLINDIVYKVDHHPTFSSNAAEYTWWTDVLSTVEIPDDIAIRFVQVHQYEFRIDDVLIFVNAMPFIKGHPCPNGSLPFREDDFCQDLGLTDICADNALYADGIYHVVDMEM